MIEQEVMCAPENSNANTPDFLTSAIKGAVVAVAITLLMLLTPLMIDCSVSVIDGDFMRNQLVV